MERLEVVYSIGLKTHDSLEDPVVIRLHQIHTSLRSVILPIYYLIMIRLGYLLRHII